MAKTPWLELLEPLRSQLRGRDHRGKKGSLRWLEAVMTEQGGRAGTVRNILYKDLGSFEEKQRLFEVLKALYAEADLASPERPSELTTATAKRLLGRDKRLIFARFSRAYAAEEAPQLVVVGPPATGKSVLLEQLRSAYPDHLFVNLSGDLAPALHTLAASLGVLEDYQQRLAKLSPTHPYAVQAQHQEDVRTLFTAPINQMNKPLFVRAEKRAHLDGLVLRDASGAEVDVSHWLEPLLGGLKVPFVTACSSAPSKMPYTSLRSPSRQEARAYLRERLPDVPPETLEALLNRAGRNYGELSRLALLELFRSGEESEAELHNDPRLGPFLNTLTALSPEENPEIPSELLETVLDKRIVELSQAERALLEPLGDTVRPGLRSLLPDAEPDEHVHRQALAYFKDGDNTFRKLFHARAAGDLGALSSFLLEDPSHLSLMPGVWQESADWPTDLRERLAKAVVRYRSVLGDYAHPECKAALEVLSASRDDITSTWARVKMSEALVDDGDFVRAAERLEGIPDLRGEARAERLLVEAALERWRGNYEEAETLVAEALKLPVPPVLSDRANLWKGLVAKDAGRFDEALKSLRVVEHTPLLMGRARYQEGDILLRTGYSEQGRACLRQALGFLRANASPEERSRVRARLGTALRRAGEYAAAAVHFRRALKDVPDPFTRARVASEASIFESARGQPWDALKLAGEAEKYFRTTSDRPEEAAYRYRRTLYRLAVAYWVWDTGEPYRPPFRPGRGSEHALRLLEPLLPQVEPLAAETDRYASLYLDINVLLTLIQDAETSWARLCKLRLPGNYLGQQLSLIQAQTQLGLGDTQGAAARLMGVRNLPPDPGLRVWKALIEAETSLLVNQEEVAVQVIDEALTLPAVFKSQLGRKWGHVLLAHDRSDLAAQWLHERGPFALPEALALRFEKI